MDQVSVHAGRSPTRCPFCKEELPPGKEVVACGACSARHHPSCHAEHGRCAACGSTEALVPRAPRRAPGRERPPKGSKIQVEEQDGETTLSWDTGITSQELGLAALLLMTCFAAPVAVLALLEGRKKRRLSVRLGKDALELPVLKGLRYAETARIPWADLGAVRAHLLHGQAQLTADEGITRHALRTGILTPRLSAPELEWLAEVITAWRDAARGA